MLRWFRWQLAKLLVVWPSGTNSCRLTSKSMDHTAKAEDFPPNERGYERLASLWDDYASYLAYNYRGLLVAAGNYYRVRIDVVLDLACGTGRHTRQLADVNKFVVGLDLSEAMLREARSRTKDANIRYLQGDFRDFGVDTIFDAAVCASDSLNYIETPDQLIDVFRCVQRHLRPGGLFAFDALDHQAFRETSTRKVIARVNGGMFEVYFFYDPDSRISEARVVVDGITERHRRIPIEVRDVRFAASEAGLTLLDHFPKIRLPNTFARQFYVLQKRVS